MNIDVANQVSILFDEIDRQTRAFQQATGLGCPPGCGRCCENPQVEVTVLDCLPLAMALFEQGTGETWLERLQSPEFDRCLFYQPDPILPGNGRCSVYPWRPLLCRTFGFATVRNKQGEPELAACAQHKLTQPETVQQCQTAITNGLPAPSFADLATQLAAIDPAIGQQCLPINRAMRLALERVGLQRQFLP
jgi:uncharacterized protein